MTKICAFVQMYNEVERGFLTQCLENAKRFCSDIVIYDDGSTDNSVEVASKYTKHIIVGKENNIRRELFHKQEILDYAMKEISPDWFFWIDCDEILCKKGLNRMQELCKLADEQKVTGLTFHELNLWRGENWCRYDTLFDKGWFTRLWKNNSRLKFNVQEGVNLSLFPRGLNAMCADFRVIHYGFCYLNKMYRHIGVGLGHPFETLPKIAPNNWILNESNLHVELVPHEVYSDENQPTCTAKPTPFVYTKENYKDHIIDPKPLGSEEAKKLYKTEKKANCYVTDGRLIL